MAEMFLTQDGGVSVSAVGRACAYTVCSVGSDLAPSQTGPHVQRNSLTPALFFRGAKPRDFGDWSALGQWAHSVMTVALTRQSPMLGWTLPQLQLEAVVVSLEAPGGHSTPGSRVTTCGSLTWARFCRFGKDITVVSGQASRCHRIDVTTNLVRNSPPSRSGTQKLRHSYWCRSVCIGRYCFFCPQASCPSGGVHILVVWGVSQGPFLTHCVRHGIFGVLNTRVRVS